MEMQMFWWVTAMVLVVAETMLPGMFCLCVGIAAATVGFVLVQAPDLSIGNQSLLFSIVGIVTSLLYAWIRTPRRGHADDVAEAPERSTQQLIGHRFVVTHPIVNGSGKIAVGHGQWPVTGDDAPAGSTVKDTATTGSLIHVAVDEASA